MSPRKTPNRPDNLSEDRAHGQGLRKVRTLLQRWWQNHSQDSGQSRDSYLRCALIFGAAHYLTTLKARRLSEDTECLSFASTLSMIKNLWPVATNHPASVYFTQVKTDDLLGDCKLQEQFISLTREPHVEEIFVSPLCPSFIYESFSMKERRTSQDLLQDDRSLVDACHLISFTQIYTPTWIVNHLLKNTLAPALAQNQDLTSLQDTSLLDPALGGGVFLVQALEYYVAAYKNFGLTDVDAIKHSLASNLFGLDIDPAALATAALSLMLKAVSLGLSMTQLENILPLANLVLLEEVPSQGKNDDESLKHFPLGSLSKDLRNIEGHPLSKRYDVVVANPPYLGRKLLPRPLKEKLKQSYPDAASDLSQAFLSMALDLVKCGGRIGFITQDSLLYLASAKNLRERILKDHQLEQIVELGSGVFPLLGGEKASTALIVIKQGAPTREQTGHFLTLVAQRDKSGQLREALLRPGGSVLSLDQSSIPVNTDIIQSTRLQSDFLADPDKVINYLRPAVVMNLRSSLSKLADIATLKQGLATTDNARFLRYIWEVEPQEIGLRFVPYARGQGVARWWSPLTTVVLWESNGLAIKEAVNQAYPYLKGNYSWVVKNEDYYFRSGLTFSFIGKDRLAVRKLAPDAIFDVGSSAIFAHNKDQEGVLLAYLNSDLATAMALDLNPTINFQVGDLKKLVLPNFNPADKERLNQLAANCVAAKQRLFALSSPLRYFQPPNTLAKSESGDLSTHTAITEKSCFINCNDYANTVLELNVCEEEIDSLVMLATTRDASLDHVDTIAIQKFAQRSKQKITTNLTDQKFCLAGLMEAMLRHFYGAKLPDATRQMAVIASLKHDQDASAFLDLWPGTIDQAFVISRLEQGKGLAHYLREELPSAFDEVFMGQPALLLIKCEAHTLLIVSPQAIKDQGTVSESGDLSQSSKETALDLLHQIKNISGLEQMRAKEMLKQIAQLKMLSLDTI